MTDHKPLDTVAWKRVPIGSSEVLWLYHSQGGNKQASSYEIALVEQIERTAGREATEEEIKEALCIGPRTAFEVEHVLYELRRAGLCIVKVEK